MADKRIIPGINRVVIKPFSDSKLKSHTLIKEQRFVDEHFQKNPWGTVVSVPDELYFWEAQAKHSIGMEDFVQVSMPWKTEMELKVGDVVLFDYLATIDDTNWFEDQYHGLLYSVRYDQIIGRKRKDVDQTLYPLNGYLFLTVEDDEAVRGGVRVETERLPEMVRGRVVAQGKPNYRYLLSSASDPLGVKFVGKSVGYKKYSAVRIEIEEYMQEKVGDWSLFSMHQKDVLFTI